MADPPSQPAGLLPERQRVLVVDDEADILKALRDTIEAYLPEVEVVTARSGKEGLAALDEHHVDLIMTDYKMPGMNGLEFLEKARGVQPNAARIMVTAYPDLQLAIQAINEEHILNFVTKPLQRENIVQTVASALAERRAQELRSRAFARSLEAVRKELQAARPPK